MREKRLNMLDLYRSSCFCRPRSLALSLLTICSYVLRMLWASLYLIIALSRRFSSIRIFRAKGESSLFGFTQRERASSSRACVQVKLGEGGEGERGARG